MIYRSGSSALVIHPDAFGAGDKIATAMVKCHLYLRLIIKTELQLIANILEKQRFYKTMQVSPKWRKTINQNEDTALINLIRLPRGELVFDALAIL